MGIFRSIRRNRIVKEKLLPPDTWKWLVEDHPMDAHRLESRLIDFTSRSGDAREGVASFLEKRAPSFASHVPTDLPDPWPPWAEPPF